MRVSACVPAHKVASSTTGSRLGVEDAEAPPETLNVAHDRVTHDQDAVAARQRLLELLGEGVERGNAVIDAIDRDVSPTTSSRR